MTRLIQSMLLAALAVLVCLPATLGAQHQMAVPDSTTFTVTAENGVPEIPFRLVNNHLVLPVSINGSPPLDVVLDTGMPSPGLALYGGPGIEALNLDIDPSIQVQIGGAGGHGASRTAQMAMEESLELPGLAIDGARVIVMPPFPGFSGYHDAVIGYSLFGRFVVELDYDRKLMRLHDPATYQAQPGAHVLPLTMRHNLPYATLQVSTNGGTPYDAEVVVDLGASHAISLNADWSDDIEVPEKTLTTVLGRGLYGPIEGRLGRISKLELAGAPLHNVLASFPVSTHQNPRGVQSLAGNLGSDVLRRFNTTFDYAGRRMILQLNKSFAEAFEFDHSGIRLTAGDELGVEHIIAGSPAEEAGVQVGDIVTHVNGEALSGKDYGDARQAFLEPGEVRLSLRRGDQILEKTLTLRRLI